MSTVITLPTETWPTDHSFDPVTGEYRGSTPADLDSVSCQQLRALVFHEPAHSTRTAPPAAVNGSARVWGGSAWTQVADHRGETWYQGTQAVTISSLGDPADANLTAAPVVPEPAAVDAVAAAKAALQTKLDAITRLGASYSSMGQPVPADLIAEHAALVAEIRAAEAA
ncbi:MAG: hypothetical protein HXX10_07750 [Rhodoplanes sp.]|uniref:hypothetical protein n=1 Tax=Rhodoplanes sp. TaxID=1968906 RepID=UPI0017C333AF|nr:hypothetical protein [Rhodoplanes sp.]NVO13915.1 hypothetical protein [Rhodoplanes sp.]